jgi:RHS repeat-associated protein
VGLGYDNASRLTIVTTNTNETTVVFGYDDANRQTWEEQTVAGFPTRRVETPRNDDGLRSGLNVPGWYGLQYDYTQRGQLWHIKDGGGTQWFAYSYDLTGNMTKRQDVYGGLNDSTNIMDSGGVSQYDQLNRPMMWEQIATVNGTHDSAFARSHFKYDSLSRLTGSWRDEQAGKGEWFGYHATGQLTDVAYNADNVSSGTPQNATRTVNYTMTPDTLNRSTMTDTGDLSTYTPNALNQYTDINGGGLYYDGNFNLMWTGGFSAGYDADKRLTAIGSGEDYGTFTYDGLGRCLKRTIDWETILITYDGWKPIVEWDQWNGLKAWNVYGPGPDEILYRHDAYLAVDLRYHLDRMGNVAFILDGNGNGIERYTYDAFGNPTVTDWDGNNPRPYSWYGNRFMFTGREYFPEFGLYDYRNRFYHPVLGRFLQSDPIGFGGGDANLYRYCGGDPVNRSDPSGLDGPEPTQKRDSNDYGNSYVGSGGQGLSTQGFWTTPEGFPTGPAGGSTGGGDPGQGGGHNGGRSFGYVGYATIARVIVTPTSSFFQFRIDPAAANFGFRPGEVATSPNSLGSLYDYGWLNRQLHQAGAVHQDRLENLQQFGSAISTATTIYVAVTIGPAGIIAGGMALYEGGSLALAAGPAIGSAAVRGYTFVYVNAPIVTATAYGTAVIGTGTVNPSVAEEVLIEIIEFEVGQPGRGIPGRWP